MVSKNQPHKITLDFINHIQNGEKRVATFLGHNIIIHNNVFPVDSPFSFSSKVTAKNIPKNSKLVLDIGTGTGVQAIVAAKNGAKKVIAIDIDDNSLINAKENISYHNLNKIIELRKSNLFDNIKKDEKFDLIISQLPFADINYESKVSHFLFDNNFELHDRLLKNAKNHLNTNGKILIPSGEVANEKKLIELIRKYDYKILEIKSETFQNLVWKLYILTFDDKN
ncbi:MAG: tRNA (adenine(22)-N(1))-methyltransferase TrmK [Nanoarchaeota archaeon]|nr:tRNA (adenine(22)-N(1))-methyltransferase TrmK [Nanoarchaeota archaeon]